MNPSTTFLLALKGTCALNCLAALRLAGPLPVTQRTVMDLTGFDDAAVSKGLATLRVLGLVTCTGDRHRTAWRLADGAERLPLPLDPVLPNPDNLDSESLFKEEEEEKERDSYNHLDSSILETPNPENLESASTVAPAELQGQPLASPAELQGQPPASTLAPPEPEPPPPLELPPSSLSPPLSPVQLRSERAERALRRRFYVAFEAAEVFLQFRRPLAEGLMRGPDGPAWLRHTLGWLCYAERRLPHIKRGAVVYISLRDRLPCDSAYLPPPELPFEAALDWAVHGGQSAPAPRAPGDDDDDDDQTPEAPGGSPESELWQALIARLARELSPAVIDSQLRPARLLSLGAERCLIGAPTPQSRDWLRTRLAAVLARALGELAGRALAVEIVVDT